VNKKRRAYKSRIVGDKVMMPADLKRLHKYMRCSTWSRASTG
jgi:hypothetical protein